MKKKLVVFHPALAPYRIDFFNSLNREFNTKFYFEHQNPLEQNFDKEIINSQLNFSYSYLNIGLFGIKNLRWDIFKILKKENPDLIFISEYTILGVLVLIYKFLFNRKAKIVITCDDNIDMAISVNLLKKITRFVLLCYVDLVLVTNDKVKDWYKKSFSENIRFFYFPIIQSESIFRSSLQKSLSLSLKLFQKYDLNNKKVILFVGRLVPVKNVTFLIKTFEQLYVKRNDLVLFIVGDGHERISLEKYLQFNIAKQSIYIVGKKEGLELKAYYNLADLFVLPSVYEPFGTVVNEALLSGCYTLCSSLAGASCLIQEPQNGGVFDPYNKQMLLDKLEYFLNKVETSTLTEVKKNRMCISYQAYMDSFIKEINALF